MLGEAELARYRALESLLPDPSLASPDPARSARVPEDQAAFLKSYESRQREILDFLRRRTWSPSLPTWVPFISDSSRMLQATSPEGS